MENLNGKHILVVEDDEVNLLIAEHILSRAGYVVSAAHHGEEAIERIQAQAYDLVLMDIEMPIMSGVEATPIIRQLPHGRHVPIIALTAHTPVPERVAEYKAAGLDDLIIKPFDGNKFQPIAERYLHA